MLQALLIHPVMLAQMLITGADEYTTRKCPVITGTVVAGHFLLGVG